SPMNKQHIKFVLVNGRTPRPQSFCALCCEAIGESYLRELTTRLGDAHAIAQKSARNRVFAKMVDCRESLLCREPNYPVAPRVEISISGDQQRANTLPL